jgi:hypothetical protein
MRASPKAAATASASSNTWQSVQEAPPLAVAVDENDAAKIICMSVAYLRAARLRPRTEASAGPPFVRLGRSVRYIVSDLERWLGDQRIRTSQA